MIRYDLEKVKEGTWVDYPEPNRDGSVPRVKLALMSGANRRYQQRLEALTKPVRRKLQIGALPESEATALYMQAFVETILLDWDHIQPEDNGVKLPFSAENATEFLSNPEWRQVYDWMQAEAQSDENFRQARLEHETKN